MRKEGFFRRTEQNLKNRFSFSADKKRKEKEGMQRTKHIRPFRLCGENGVYADRSRQLKKRKSNTGNQNSVNPFPLSAK